jgi:hypothetical protein
MLWDREHGSSGTDHKLNPKYHKKKQGMREEGRKGGRKEESYVLYPTTLA